MKSFFQFLETIQGELSEDQEDQLSDDLNFIGSGKQFFNLTKKYNIDLPTLRRIAWRVNPKEMRHLTSGILADVDIYGNPLGIHPKHLPKSKDKPKRFFQ